MENAESKNLDESLYSRQLYVLGTDTMSKLMSSTVLIYGMDGLGQEIAKNIVLAGINTLLIYDPTPVTPFDLCAGFYFTEEHLGSRRDMSVLSSLRQLNPYVTVTLYDPTHPPSLLPSPHPSPSILSSPLHHTNPPINMIVCCNIKHSLLLSINTITRKNNIPFISCQTRGFFSQIFTDFGPSFTTYDITGEPVLTGPINDISQEGILTTADKIRHELEDGNVIKILDNIYYKDTLFSVNVMSPFKLKLTPVNTVFTFIVCEGGIYEQVKVPVTLQFLPFAESLLTPDIVNLSHSTPETDLVLHKCFLTLNTYFKKGVKGDRGFNNNVSKLEAVNTVDSKQQGLNIQSSKLEGVNNNTTTTNTINTNINNNTPSSYITDVNIYTPLDTDTFISIYEQEYGNAHKHDNLIRLFCKQSYGVIMPMCSIIGGIVAQEIIKGCTYKYYPLHQFMYFESSIPMDKGSDNDNHSSLMNVIDNGSVVEGVNNIDSKQQGVNIVSSRLEGVSDRDSKQQVVSNSTNTLEGVNTCTVNNTPSYTLPFYSTVPDRYFPIIYLLGYNTFIKLINLNIFLIGAGAIGCEHLKNMVMCGMCVNNTLSITDMDSIETSNLNRQFLFKKKDVQRMKSEVAKEEVLKMNSDYNRSNKSSDNIECSNKDCNSNDNKSDSNIDYNTRECNNIYTNPNPTNPNTNTGIHSFNLKVGKETEEVFSDKFYCNTSFIVNALDNIEARMYVDKRCIITRRPLFESGTLGTKGNVQVIIPCVTESYGSSRDPPEKSIPLCTLRNFPHCIEHTIEWGLSEFKSNFEEGVISVVEGVNDKDDELDNVKGVNTIDTSQGVSNSTDNNTTIDNPSSSLLSSVPRNSYDCVINSIYLFNSYFYDNIKKLIDTFPVDHVTEEGQPFWVPPKRAPVPFSFCFSDPLHVLFVKSYVKIMCSVYGYEGVSDTEIEVIIKRVVEGVNNKSSEQQGVNDKGSNIDEVVGVNNKGSKVKSIEGVNDNTNNQQGVNNTTTTTNTNTTITPAIFEKDNDSNGHVDFIYCCANLRARNYKIKEVSRLVVKGVAGKIIPAIATTTSVVSGLCVMEILRYITSNTQYKNWYVNLALPFISHTDTIKAELLHSDIKGISYNIWNRIEFGDCTLNTLISYFKDKYDIDVNMITIRDIVVYCNFYNVSKFKGNLDKRVSELSCRREGDVYCCVECLFDVDGDSFPEIVVNYEREEGSVEWV